MTTQYPWIAEANKIFIAVLSFQLIVSVAFSLYLNLGQYALSH